jgi:hypothetical protein
MVSVQVLLMYMLFLANSTYVNITKREKYFFFPGSEQESKNNVWKKVYSQLRKQK